MTLCMLSNEIFSLHLLHTYHNCLLLLKESLRLRSRFNDGSPHHTTGFVCLVGLSGRRLQLPGPLLVRAQELGRVRSHRCVRGRPPVGSRSFGRWATTDGVVAFLVGSVGGGRTAMTAPADDGQEDDSQSEQDATHDGAHRKGEGKGIYWNSNLVWNALLKVTVTLE